MVEETERKGESSPEGASSLRDTGTEAGTEAKESDSSTVQEDSPSKKEKKPGLYLLEGGDFSVVRLPPYADAAFTGAWTKQQRQDVANYLHTTKRAPEEVYARMEEPVRKLAEAKDKPEGIAYYIDDLLEGSKRYVNNVIEAVNSTAGTELNTMTEEGELGGLGTFVEDGGWTLGLYFLGPFAGGALNLVDTAIQASREDYQEVYGDGLFDMGLDAANEYLGREVNEGHFLFGQLPENPTWWDTYKRMLVDEATAAALFGGIVTAVKHRGSLMSAVKRFAKDESGAVQLPINKMPAGVDKKKAAQAVELVGTVQKEQMEKMPEQVKRLIRDPKMHKTIQETHNAYKNGQIALNLTAATKRVEDAIKALKGKYPQKAKALEEAIESPLKREMPIQDEAHFYGLVDKFEDQVKRGATDETKIQTLVAGLEQQSTYIKKFKEGKATITGESKGQIRKRGGKKAQEEVEIYTTEEQQKALKGKGAVEGVFGGQEAKTLALMEQMERIAVHAVTEKNTDVQKALMAMLDGMEGFMASHGTATGKNLALMARANVFSQGVREVMKVTRDRLASVSNAAKRAKVIKDMEKTIEAMGKQSRMSKLSSGAVHFANRLLINNFVGRGALKSAVLGNTASMLTEGVWRMAKNPTNALGFAANTGISLASALLTHLNPKTYWNIGRRVARGSGGGQLAQEAISEAKTVKGKLANIATGTNFFALETVDSFMAHAARNMISMDALEKGVKRRRAAGSTWEEIADQYGKLAKGDAKYMADVGVDLVHGFEDRLGRMAMRADDPEVFAPMLSRPLWWTRDAAKKLGYSAGPTLGALAERLTLFARTGANVVDFMSRNSMLRYLDALPGLGYGRFKGLELGRATVGQATGMGIWGLINMQYDQDGNLPVKVEESPYSTMGGSKRYAQAFRKKKGVRIAGHFLELKDMGNFGEYQRVQQLAMDTLDRAWVNGDMDAVSRIGDALWGFTSAAYAEQWFVNDFLSFLAYVERGPGETLADGLEKDSWFKRILSGITPFGSDMFRYWTASRGALPSGTYIDAKNALNDHLAMQVNPFGRPMDGVDRATRFMEGSPQYWQENLSSVDMFLNPNEAGVYDIQTEQLNNFLLETGAFERSKNYYVKLEDGGWQKLHTDRVDENARVTMRPLRMNASYRGIGDVRLSEIDKNKARMLLSLDMEMVEQVFDSWHSKVSQIPSDNEHIEGLKQGLENETPIEAMRSVRNGFEDIGMAADEDTTAFLHRIATDRLENLPGELQAQVEEYKGVYAFFLNKPLDTTGVESFEQEDFSPEFIESMARKHVIANLWNTIEATVHSLHIYAPSAIEQAELLWVPKGEEQQ